MAAARSSGGGEEEDFDALALRLATDEENATLVVRKRLFIAIGVLNIAMNFDSGGLPATCVRPSSSSRAARLWIIPSSPTGPASSPRSACCDRSHVYGARCGTGSGTCRSSSTSRTLNSAS